MVVFYDLETKEIRYTEDNQMEPMLPMGDTTTKQETLKEDGLGFISVPYEVSNIRNYRLIFDDKDSFIALQPNSDSAE